MLVLGEKLSEGILNRDKNDEIVLNEIGDLQMTNMPRLTSEGLEIS